MADDQVPGEVVVAPAERRRVDAGAGGVEVDDDQAPAHTQCRGRLERPRVQVVQVREEPAGVDEVEAAPAQVDRQLVRVGLEEEDLRKGMTRLRQRLLGHVDAGHHRAERGELGAHLAGAALLVQHVCALQVG